MSWNKSVNVRVRSQFQTLSPKTINCRITQPNKNASNPEMQFQDGMALKWQRDTQKTVRHLRRPSNKAGGSRDPQMESRFTVEPLSTSGAL